jgi:23S rRNA (guanosine2251-2'-O)-methyltransferase
MSRPHNPSGSRHRSRDRARDRDAGLGGEQVEGRQAVRELLRARRRRVHYLTITRGDDPSGALAEILDLATTAGVTVRRVDRAQLAALALTDAPQGVVARADPLPAADLAALAAAAADGPRPFVVVLDGVTDPGNLGAIMRSAVSAGATGLVTRRRRAAAFTPAALKAAAGATEYLPVASVAGIPAALAELAGAGLWAVAVDADAVQPLWDLRVADQPIALVLGAEGGGLGRLVRDRCDVAVSIPLSGPVESLNVAAAATLACFEVARQRRGWDPRPGPARSASGRTAGRA